MTYAEGSSCEAKIRLKPPTIPTSASSMLVFSFSHTHVHVSPTGCVPSRCKEHNTSNHPHEQNVSLKASPVFSRPRPKGTFQSRFRTFVFFSRAGKRDTLFCYSTICTPPYSSQTMANISIVHPFSKPLLPNFPVPHWKGKRPSPHQFLDKRARVPTTSPYFLSFFSRVRL